MALPRSVTVAAFPGELARFEATIREVPAPSWDNPSCCEGWSAGDVAKHVVGQFADVAAGRLEGLGTDEVTRREVAERTGLGPDQVADELADLAPVLAAMLDAFDEDAWGQPVGSGLSGTLGEGVEALWSDMIIHADDIRRAAGQDRPDIDVTAAVSHMADVLTQQEHAPLTLALDGLPEFTVSGGGERLAVEPWAFLLAATGRAPADSIGQDGTINVYR
jgi:uncharacterized protein (TIGR03083 family)